ncbi:MAG: PilZ domain-containing protein [Thermodesulfobacteriota bacterium]
MKANVEKRSKIRKPFRKPVHFEQMATALNRQKRNQWTGVSFDISEDGVGVTVDYPLKKGEVIKLFIPVSRKSATLPVFAEVRWVRSTEDKFRTGLRFLQ